MKYQEITIDKKREALINYAEAKQWQAFGSEVVADVHIGEVFIFELHGNNGSCRIYPEHYDTIEEKVTRMSDENVQHNYEIASSEIARLEKEHEQMTSYVKNREERKRNFRK